MVSETKKVPTPEIVPSEIAGTIRNDKQWKWTNIKTRHGNSEKEVRG